MTIREEHARPVELTELTEEQLDWVTGGAVILTNPNPGVGPKATANSTEKKAQHGQQINTISH
jgi:hypothetical protein